MSTIERLNELAKGATQGRRSLGNENNECCDISLSDELDLRVSLDRHDGCTGKIIIDREQMIANAHFIIECNPAAIAQAAAEHAAVVAERDALKVRNAELDAKVRVLANTLEVALHSVESMQRFELCREIEDLLDSVQSLQEPQQISEHEARSGQEG